MIPKSLKSLGRVHTAQPQRNFSRQGFTLIELLVVIAIIALLAAILFPVFSRAREQARKSSCLSNMKQIGLGIMQYTQDFDETIPRMQFISYSGTGSNWYEGSLHPDNPSVDASGNQKIHYKWMDAVFPYVKSTQVFVCPSAGPQMIKPASITSDLYSVNNFQLYGGATPDPLSTGSKRNGSYAINGAYWQDQAASDVLVHSPPGNRIVRIVRPAETVLAADGNGAPFFGPGQPSATAVMVLDGTFAHPIFKVAGGNVHTYASGVVQRHLEFTNVLYCDGHVKSKKMDEFAPTKTITWRRSNPQQPVHYNLTIEDD